MKKTSRQWLSFAGMISLVFITFLTTFQLSRLFTRKNLPDKDYQIERLSREIKWNNRKYIEISMENDSLKLKNNALMRSADSLVEQKNNYMELYRKYKIMYLALPGESADSIITIDTVFYFADEVIRMQEIQISHLESININNNEVILNLEKQLNKTSELLKLCNQMADDSVGRLDKVEKKLAKVKNKRNIWIGIGLTEALVITAFLLLAANN